MYYIYLKAIQRPIKSPELSIYRTFFNYKMEDVIEGLKDVAEQLKVLGVNIAKCQNKLINEEGDQTKFERLLKDLIKDRENLIKQQENLMKAAQLNKVRSESKLEANLSSHHLGTAITEPVNVYWVSYLILIFILCFCFKVLLAPS